MSGWCGLRLPGPGAAPRAQAVSAGGCNRVTPQQRYHKALRHGDLIPDPAQAQFVTALEQLHRALSRRHPSRLRGWLSPLRWARGTRQVAPPIQGLYVWGGVGRGKTLLVDGFYDTLAFDAKLRIHFHDFMQQVHDHLQVLRQRQDPLLEVAADLADRIRVLCFDEFQVSDIADAMILGRLLEALFARGVVLVATSNTAPEDLYARGLQRQRFVPAIKLIQRHTRIMHLDSARDYRLRALQRAAVYHQPLDEDSALSMAQCFRELAADCTLTDRAVAVAGRTIVIRGLAYGCVWFDFKELCETARSASDYLELARRYHTIMVSNVPQLDATREDPAVRFIHLVDNLYDHQVNLVLSAAVEPQALYTGKRHGEAFQRTRSRLEEMQSHHYLTRGHLS